MANFLPNYRMRAAGANQAARSAPAGGGGGPPTQGSMWGWWRGDSLTGTTTATGWTDKTANGRNLAQTGSPTINASGLNSKKTVSLGTTTRRFALTTFTTLAQPFTVVAVCRSVHSNGKAEYLFQSGVEGSNNMIGMHIGYDDAVFNVFENAGTGIITTSNLTSNTWQTLIIIVNGASSAVYKDNSSIGTGNLGTLGMVQPLCFGQWLGETTSEFNWNGDFAELAIYSKALDSGERGDWDSYVATEYGI